ncbi:Farnesyltranstransferase [Phytophthora palmivora]|uniref:Farnesyltranstransferase n=1 Tax=Phytophthora palmivora TaxID=4796 RepID=A0A2P4WZJ3_9STRA|nr:Farnesyltranstransferase [Phytophthora palmivora]
MDPLFGILVNYFAMTSKRTASRSKALSTSNLWVGDLTRGVWSKLVHCARLQKFGKTIRDELEAGKYPFPVVEPFDRKEEKTSGYSPFKYSD